MNKIAILLTTFALTACAPSGDQIISMKNACIANGYEVKYIRNYGNRGEYRDEIYAVRCYDPVAQMTFDASTLKELSNG